MPSAPRQIFSCYTGVYPTLAIAYLRRQLPLSVLCINTCPSIYLHLLFFPLCFFVGFVCFCFNYSICQKYSEFLSYFSVLQVTLSRWRSSEKLINTSCMPLLIAIMKIPNNAGEGQTTMKPWLNELKCSVHNQQLI